MLSFRFILNKLSNTLLRFSLSTAIERGSEFVCKSVDGFMDSTKFMETASCYPSLFDLHSSKRYSIIRISNILYNSLLAYIEWPLANGGREPLFSLKCIIYAWNICGYSSRSLVRTNWIFQSYGFPFISMIYRLLCFVNIIYLLHFSTNISNWPLFWLSSVNR